MNKEQLNKAIQECDNTIQIIVNIGGFGYTESRQVVDIINSRKQNFEKALSTIDQSEKYKSKYKTLEVSRSVTDYERKFRIEGVQGDISLKKDKIKEGDGLFWGLKSGTMVQAHYSADQIQHKENMKSVVPIKDGEKVIIEGKMYKTKINGNYSDAVEFEPYMHKSIIIL